MPDERFLSAVGWRDRLIIIAGLAAAIALAWLYMADMHLGVGGMPAHMSHAHMHAWGASGFLFALGMWSVMMIGMMLPSASPMVLTFAAITRQRLPASALWRTGLFVLGYVIVWLGYSVAATAAQWSFHSAAMLSPRGVSTSPYLAAGLLFVAGGFQLTPFKYACLEKCRTPLGFILYEWRPGPKGALIMGLRHGVNCVACCWALMALMLVLGVMNIWWMLALTAFSLVEKIAPAPVWTGRVAGAAMIGWGVLILHAGR